MKGIEMERKKLVERNENLIKKKNKILSEHKRREKQLDL